MQVNYADDFTSYDEDMIRVNCERMINISSEIEVVNDWVGKNEIIESLKLQINQLKCEVVYMKNEMDEKNFQIRSLLIQESKDLADVYDSNENNNNLNNLFSTEISSTTNAILSTHLSTHLSSTTSIIEPNDCVRTLQTPQSAKLKQQLEIFDRKNKPTMNT